MKTLMLAVSALAAVTACSTRHELSNDGAVCALASADGSWEETPQAFAENAPAWLHYVSHACLSSSCDTERTASCIATVEGDRIIVESQAGYTSSGAGACTDDCGSLSARCATPPLAAGRYTIVHGTDTTTLTVPSEVATAPCTAPPRW